MNFFSCWSVSTCVCNFIDYVHVSFSTIIIALLFSYASLSALWICFLDALSLSICERRYAMMSSLSFRFSDAAAVDCCSGWPIEAASSFWRSLSVLSYLRLRLSKIFCWPKRSCSFDTILLSLSALVRSSDDVPSFIWWNARSLCAT